MSVPQMPHAATLMRTSPSPTSGTGTSSTWTTPLSRKTPARIVFGMGPTELSVSDAVPILLCGRDLFYFRRCDAWPVLRDCLNISIQKIRQRFTGGAALPSKLNQQGNAVWTEANFFEQAAHFQMAMGIENTAKINGQI